MPAEDNAPLGAPTGREPGEDRGDGPRRSLGLIFGLLVVAALLLVAGLLLRRAQTERVNQGTPVARPILSGVGTPSRVASPPGR